MEAILRKLLDDNATLALEVAKGGWNPTPEQLERRGALTLTAAADLVGLIAHATREALERQAKGISVYIFKLREEEDGAFPVAAYTQDQAWEAVLAAENEARLPEHPAYSMEDVQGAFEMIGAASYTVADLLREGAARARPEGEP